MYFLQVVVVIGCSYIYFLGIEHMLKKEYKSFVVYVAAATVLMTLVFPGDDILSILILPLTASMILMIKGVVIKKKYADKMGTTYLRIGLIMGVPCYLCGKIFFL